jgi:hypothetical protein
VIAAQTMTKVPNNQNFIRFNNFVFSSDIIFLQSYFSVLGQTLDRKKISRKGGMFIQGMHTPKDQLQPLHKTNASRFQRIYLRTNGSEKPFSNQLLLALSYKYQDHLYHLFPRIPCSFPWHD